AGLRVRDPPNTAEHEPGISSTERDRRGRSAKRGEYAAASRSGWYRQRRARRLPASNLVRAAVLGSRNNAADRALPSALTLATLPALSGTGSIHGDQVAWRPFERLNVSGLQNAAALRYQIWYVRTSPAASKP